MGPKLYWALGLRWGGQFVSLFYVRTVTSWQFQPGDQVRVATDEKRVEELQKGHGGWVSDMKKVRLNRTEMATATDEPEIKTAMTKKWNTINWNNFLFQYLGKTGKVMKSYLNGYKVQFPDKRWYAKAKSTSWRETRLNSLCGLLFDPEKQYRSTDTFQMNLCLFCKVPLQSGSSNETGRNGQSSRGPNRSAPRCYWQFWPSRQEVSSIIFHFLLSISAVEPI